MKTILIIIGLTIFSEICHSQHINVYYKDGKKKEIHVSLIDSVTFSRVIDSAFTDIDGNVYKSVVINTQEWMAENLNVSRYRNGDVIHEVSDSVKWGDLDHGAFCDYQNAPSLAKIYGKLYNFHAIIDERNLCPIGWHVPTDSDWNILVSYLGGGMVAGGKMKEADHANWTPPNIDATNESGFTALPAGNRLSECGCFNYLESYAFFWTSTKMAANRAWGYYIGNKNAIIERNYYGRANGFSVRCLKDEAHKLFWWRNLD